MKTIKSENIFNGKVDDFSAMLISAERYAMGRRTYIVKWTCEFICNNLHLLTQKDKLVMIEDIESSRNYGADFDKKDWMNLLKELKKSIDVENTLQEQNINEKTEQSCDTCKHYHSLMDIGDIHTLCSKGVCYMCVYDGEDCDLYDEGDVPEGKTRGV